jgi:hypothetical protein
MSSYFILKVNKYLGLENSGISSSELIGPEYRIDDRVFWLGNNYVAVNKAGTWFKTFIFDTGEMKINDRFETSNAYLFIANAAYDDTYFYLGCYDTTIHNIVKRRKSDGAWMQDEDIGNSVTGICKINNYVIIPMASNYIRITNQETGVIQNKWLDAWGAWQVAAVIPSEVYPTVCFYFLDGNQGASGIGIGKIDLIHPELQQISDENLRLSDLENNW